MLITAQSARRSAYMFNWGSIAAVLLPIPFLPLFFGASVFLYTINRNHPEPKSRFGFGRMGSEPR